MRIVKDRANVLVTKAAEPYQTTTAGVNLLDCLLGISTVGGGGGALQPLIHHLNAYVHGCCLANSLLGTGESIFHGVLP